MRSRMSSRIATVLAACTLAGLAGIARADGPGDPGDPPMPPPAIPITPTPIYPAPLSQVTQTTYVPQSVALSGPAIIEEFDERHPPLGYTAVQRKRKNLATTGAVFFGMSYGISALSAAIGQDVARGSGGSNGAAYMWLPVLGPFLELSKPDSAEMP
jgi:hypothetical protein